MKTILFFACLHGLLQLAHAETHEVFQDDYLAQTSYEYTTLGEIYLALPQDFFELTYRERIDFLIRGWIQFDADRKRIYVPGDGGQSRITAIVQKQTKEELILDVTLEFEGDKREWTLKRERTKWVGTLKTQ